MSDETLEVNKAQDTAPATEDSKNTNPTQETDNQPVYTKEQFNAAMKSARISGEQSVAKKFSGVDVEHYNSLIKLHKVKVDGALLNAASKHKAINPDQVVKLVRDQVKMSETGQVEIVDPKTGNTRYTESGEPLDIDNAVQDWLRANPHFVSAGPSGSGATSNQNPEGVKQVDINKLDLKDPEQRKLYAEMRKKIYPNIV